MGWIPSKRVVSVSIVHSHRAVIRIVKAFFDITKAQEAKHMKECVMFYNVPVTGRVKLFLCRELNFQRVLMFWSHLNSNYQNQIHFLKSHVRQWGGCPSSYVSKYRRHLSVFSTNSCII